MAIKVPMLMIGIRANGRRVMREVLLRKREWLREFKPQAISQYFVI
jgi:hypothetical protein